MSQCEKTDSIGRRIMEAYAKNASDYPWGSSKAATSIMLEMGRNMSKTYDNAMVAASLPSASVEQLYEELKSRPSVDKVRLLNAYSQKDIFDHLNSGSDFRVMNKSDHDKMMQMAMNNAECGKPCCVKTREDKPWWADSWNPDVD